MRKVFVALRMSGEAGRSKLAGIYRYLANRPNWQIALIESPLELTPDAVARALADGTDGFIISSADPLGGLAPLRRSARPVVVMEPHDHPLARRRRNAVLIRNNSQAIATAAFDHLFEQGRFLSYVYVPAKENESWSHDRGTAFAELAAAKGIAVTPYSGDIPLTDFLKSLPKPAAVFAANDIRAVEVLQAAKIARLAVPTRVAVLGVDDNALICENARPTLSSIRPDFEEEGFLAAQALDALMSTGNRQPTTGNRLPTTIYVGVKKVVRRDSTFAETPSGRLVARALKYIADHATDGITVGDVVRHLKVSRRLLYLRFAEECGTSVRAAIEERRLQQVRHLLNTTQLTTDEIATRCGYGNPNVLRNLVKRTYGCAMRDMRELGRRYCFGNEIC